MHILKTVISMVFAALFLAACGGGSSSETSPKLNITGEALYIAYDQIVIGMNYEQVRALVGIDPNVPQKSDQTDSKLYIWDNGATSLLVVFSASTGRIGSKSVDGPPGKGGSSAYRY